MAFLLSAVVASAFCPRTLPLYSCSNPLTAGLIFAQIGQPGNLSLAGVDEQLRLNQPLARIEKMQEAELKRDDEVVELGIRRPQADDEKRPQLFAARRGQRQHRLVAVARDGLDELLVTQQLDRMAHDLGRRPDDAADEVANGDGEVAIRGGRQRQRAQGAKPDRLLRGQRVIGVH